MINRLIATTLTLSMLASTMPAIAAEVASTAVELPSELPCEGKNGKDRARCITDALKAWKVLEDEYNDAEDEVVDAWKKEHANMGIGADYQTALRTFLTDMRNARKEFRAQLQEFRKVFFAEQKAKLKAGNTSSSSSSKAVQPKLEKSTLDAAKAKCGVEDDDGAFRLCMRLQLRKHTTNATKRSRTNSEVIHQN